MNLLIFESQSERYVLTSDDIASAHLRRILRVRPGDTVRVGVVDGPRGTATVESIDRSTVILSARWDDRPQDPSLPITVLVGHPRPPVLTRIWRDLASMAVARIVVFTAQLTEKSYRRSSIWTEPRQYLLDGLRQGGHTRLPRLEYADSVVRATSDLPGEALRIFADPQAPGGLVELAARLDKQAKGVVLCVGPERGLTGAETDHLRKVGFDPVSLGRSILRTETATILLAGFVASGLAGVCTE